MIPTLKLPRDQVEALRPRDVQHYLKSRGWVVDEADSSPIASIFRNPSMRDAEVVLPLKRDLADYTLRMTDVVHVLAIVEDRPFLEILNDLSAPPSDVLRMHVSGSVATLGNLPLEEGIQLLWGGRDMLLSAACSVSRPQAFYPEKTLIHAKAFIKKCLLGQTERGSFTATIMAPVSPALEQRNFLVDDVDFRETTEPFERRVTTRLMTGLDVIDRAIKTSRLDPILNGVAAGVSANLCEAVAAMKPPGDQSRLDIRMSWSRSRPRVPSGIPQAISFAQPDFDIIEEAARKLRERPIPRRDRFEGKILSLQSEVASFFDVGGKIIIRTLVGSQPARVKVVLNREDYKLACDAHRDDQRVAVTGVIHPDIKIRVYELSEPDDFRVLKSTG